MRNARVWQRALGLVRTVIEAIHFDEEADAVVVSVRPRKGARRRCGRCGKRASWYDRGEGRRRWRALDLGTTRVVLEADSPRVACPRHGPTVVQVPWARHGARHTTAFDETVAWLAVRTSKSAVVELMRVTWRTVGSIVTRVQADLDASFDRLAGLRRIGIDEISYKRGHRYLTVVVDHDSGSLVWVGAGASKATLGEFFDLLGPQRCAQITHVSADGADWIARVVAERCPSAVLCADPFHVVKWATEALDVVRRESWNQARKGQVLGLHRRGSTGYARDLKHARYALWKNPENLTERQRVKLAWITERDPRLYRAYLLKEGLRLVFALGGAAGIDALDRWLVWASRCRIAAFVELARQVRRHRPQIEAALLHGLSQGLIESTNTKIRLLTRMAFGFHGPQPLMALAILALGAHRPALPGR